MVPFLLIVVILLLLKADWQRDRERTMRSLELQRKIDQSDPCRDWHGEKLRNEAYLKKYRDEELSRRSW
jgi:hypothetical protein